MYDVIGRAFPKTCPAVQETGVKRFNYCFPESQLRSPAVRRGFVFERVLNYNNRAIVNSARISVKIKK
jgi:hypothetical protein